MEETVAPQSESQSPQDTCRSNPRKRKAENGVYSHPKVSSTDSGARSEQNSKGTSVPQASGQTRVPSGTAKDGSCSSKKTYMIKNPLALPCTNSGTRPKQIADGTSILQASGQTPVVLSTPPDGRPWTFSGMKIKNETYIALNKPQARLSTNSGACSQQNTEGIFVLQPSGQTPVVNMTPDGRNGEKKPIVYLLPKHPQAPNTNSGACSQQNTKDTSVLQPMGQTPVVNGTPDGRNGEKKPVVYLLPKHPQAPNTNSGACSQHNIKDTSVLQPMGQIPVVNMTPDGRNGDKKAITYSLLTPPRAPNTNSGACSQQYTKDASVLQPMGHTPVVNGTPNGRNGEKKPALYSLLPHPQAPNTNSGACSQQNTKDTSVLQPMGQIPVVNRIPDGKNGEKKPVVYLLPKHPQAPSTNSETCSQQNTEGTPVLQPSGATPVLNRTPDGINGEKKPIMYSLLPHPQPRAPNTNSGACSQQNTEGISVLQLSGQTPVVNVTPDGRNGEKKLVAYLLLTHLQAPNTNSGACSEQSTSGETRGDASGIGDCRNGEKQNVAYVVINNSQTHPHTNSQASKTQTHPHTNSRTRNTQMHPYTNIMPKSKAQAFTSTTSQTLSILHSQVDTDHVYSQAHSDTPAQTDTNTQPHTTNTRAQTDTENTLTDQTSRLKPTGAVLRPTISTDNTQNHPNGLGIKASSRTKRRCPFCNLTLSCKSALFKHKWRKHKEEAFVERKSRCQPCRCDHCPDFKCATIRMLIEHHRNKHQADMKICTKNFRTEEEFFQWKRQVEEQEDMPSKYVKSQKAKPLKSLVLLSYYYCHRSGTFKTRADRKRALKKQGTAKIAKCCTSFMITRKTLSTGTVSVEYCLQHMGHGADLTHIPLSAKVKAIISGQLRLGITAPEILENIREDVPGLSARDRLVTRKDIVNIKHKYNLCDVPNARTRQKQPKAKPSDACHKKDRQKKACSPAEGQADDNDDDNDNGNEDFCTPILHCDEPAQPEASDDVKLLRSAYNSLARDITELVNRTCDESALRGMFEHLAKAYSVLQDSGVAGLTQNSHTSPANKLKKQRRSTTKRKKRKASK